MPTWAVQRRVALSGSGRLSVQLQARNPRSYILATFRYYGYYLGVYGTYGTYDMDFRESFVDRRMGRKHGVVRDADSRMLKFASLARERYGER